MRPKVWKVICAASLLIIFLIKVTPQNTFGQTRQLPNILWLVSEDNSPMAGAYGDEFATTPNMDMLAETGFLYTNAYANAPVCAPARNTIITGVYANSNGNQHMRSTYRVSESIRFFPLYLRQAGYYVTNNAKEDYNIDGVQVREIWNESGREAHYLNRDEGQPFFAVFNNHQSHESSIHNLKPVDELRHDPGKVTLPPYHPDTPEIRRDWAQYYDNIEDMDQWLGEMLKELEESGEAENTIVFYYSDHGGVLPRSKRFVYETGTRVPFIVHIPEKFRHLWPASRTGSEVDRLISFVDLAPTMLSLIETPIPEFMQGNAFLGEQKTTDPEYVYMFRDRMDERYDMSRAVKGSRFRYIRNYMPYRIYGQKINYLWRAASMRSWEETCLKGGCNEIQNLFWNTKPAEELYDTVNDPWEVKNLADDPDYSGVLQRMRSANRAWMIDIMDTGFIPEAENLDLVKNKALYDYIRTENVQIDRIIDIADLAVSANADDLESLTSLLKSDDHVIRYWAAAGLLILGEDARPAIPDLTSTALHDTSPNVVTVVSEALYELGQTEAARSGFIKVLASSNEFARTHVLNAIDSVDDNSKEVQDAVIRMAREAGVLTSRHYDHRAAASLFEKWGIDSFQIDP